MPHKLGRKPAVRTLRTMRLALATAKALDPLGTPPPKPNDYIGKVPGACPMFGNDQYGCCVSADTAHMLMIRTYNTGAPIAPTVQDVLQLYTNVSSDPKFDPEDPDTDNGLAEIDMLDYLKSTGFLGHRLNNYGNVDPSNFNHLKWCVQLFGGARIGVNLTKSAMDQFDNNLPWALTTDRDIIGGHDVPIVDYDPYYFYVCTWGRWRHPVSYDWLLKFCEEAHPELAFDWINQQGVSPAGFDLSMLELRVREAMAVPEVIVA